MFEPLIDLKRLQPLLDALEQARRDIEALNVPPALERALQRATEARGAHMSTRIEGNPMTEEEVRAEFARPTPGTSRAELENRDYRDAARFATQVAGDFDADIDGGLIRALHYLVERNTDTHGTAGQYRSEQNVVRDSRTGALVYQPPPTVQVPALMSELIAWLREHRRDTHPAILAAIAHVELVKVHPFNDGNGRTARALTRYFLERHGWHLRGYVAPEDVFGIDTPAYYRHLADLGSAYASRRPDLTAWVQWFLVGFVAESATGNSLARDFALATRDSVARLGIAGRLADGVVELWLTGSLSRQEYATALGVSAATAAHDLGLIVAGRLAERRGQGRATRYFALSDPFAAARDSGRVAAREALARLGF